MHTTCLQYWSLTDLLSFSILSLSLFIKKLLPLPQFPNNPIEIGGTTSLLVITIATALTSFLMSNASYCCSSASSEEMEVKDTCCLEIVIAGSRSEVSVNCALTSSFFPSGCSRGLSFVGKL